VAPTLQDKIIGGVYTSCYSIVVIVFGFTYKKLALIQTLKENHRYQKSFDDALINRIFIFNFLNFYGPMLLVAFYIRNYDNLFMMMLTQMAGKQIILNLLEYFTPIFKVRGKLNDIKDKFE